MEYYLDKDIKQLLKQCKIEINNKKFKEIYNALDDAQVEGTIIGKFTQTLLEAKIDPLLLDENLNYIPYCYLQNSAISEFVVPSKVKFIGESSFLNSDLKEISFEQGSNLTHIKEYAFYGCSFLKDIRLPSGVEILGERCFSLCEDLEYIYLPKTLHVIGHGCFQSTYMEEIEYEGSMKNFENILEKFFTNITKGHIKYIKCADGVYELK